MDWLRIAIAIALLVLIAFAVLTLFGTPRRFQPLLAVLRGTAQLAVLSLILGGIIQNRVLVLLALAVMASAAVVVSARRLGGGRRAYLGSAAAIAAGCGTAMAVVFGSGALEPTSRYLLAFAGILIGNAMTITTLTGRTARTTVRDHWDEVEGWLALGASPRQATVDLARRASYSALVPLVDQTRTTGLVVLPGAFVGAIFGGLSPLVAGAFQLLVLCGAIAAGAIASVILLLVIGPAVVRPDDELAQRSARDA
ncbi:ABC transporter permease [Naasia lichenicola]|uniref:ABC transporter permease n=1 Tax=Naasia lichenicola TaxID=2565933 RepID=A0A4S4FHN6_9MICO|nr:ABC transporter permease [Naasia lichenicola]THG29833.1 ABC transporter permease [Naasia lichenicola]